MPAAALAATLAVAFVGGAGGAILGPWITSHLGKRQRLAQRKAEPYRNVLQAAQHFVRLSSRTHQNGASGAEADEWFDAANALSAAATNADADAVTTDDIRRLCDELFRAGWHVVETPGSDNETATWEELRELLRPRIDALDEQQAAYERLRAQVQRETNG